MNWKNTLRKAQLPENLPQVGEPVDNEKRQQLDQWGEAYERDVVRQLQERYNEMEGGYRQKGSLHLGPNEVIFSPTRMKVKRSYSDFANDVKGFVRDVYYAPHKFNYGDSVKLQAKIPNKIIAVLQMRTSFANTFGDWLQSKGLS